MNVESCVKCEKEISDNEWVDNWGYCADCLNASFTKYLESHQAENPSEDRLIFEESL
jgi:hypothetical protein